jgi:hypothetical protein
LLSITFPSHQQYRTFILGDDEPADCRAGGNAAAPTNMSQASWRWGHARGDPAPTALPPDRLVQAV